MQSTSPNDDPARRIRRAGVVLAGVAGATVAAVQLRHGIVPLLDTVTYWSGAESVASGDFFRTELAPSFSNFDAVDFVERGGRLPFVDFPIAYPLLAGLGGLVIGTRAAMHLLAIVAVAAMSAAITSGLFVRRTDSSPGVSNDVVDQRRGALIQLVPILLFACLVPLLPATRLVTQGTLSEPLFVGIVLMFVVVLARYRNGGAWAPVVVLVIVGSLLRFLGAPLAVLAGWEHGRRTRRFRRSCAWTVGMLLPAGVNMVAASAAGGGHNAGWRGFDRVDLDIFVRSIGGWFDGTQGDIRRTYFTTDGPTWWSWPVTAVMCVFMVVAVIAVIRRTRCFTDAADLALTSAAILTAGLITGIAGFDALVIADNRLMLPAGILVTSALVWTAIDRMSRHVANRPDRRRMVPWTTAVSCIVVLWGLAAVRPWNALERFSDIERPLAMSSVVSDLDIDVVISNDADGVHWDTGVPAAYTPMPVKPLTGEIVDDAEIYDRLPCPLLRARGAIVISNETTFSTVNRGALRDLVESGRLEMLTTDRATVFRPTGSACDD